MKILSVFIKSLKENLRDWKILILTLTFAPFFIVLMYFSYGGGTSMSYHVVAINNDQPVPASNGTLIHAGNDLISGMEKKQIDSNILLRITETKDEENAKTLVKDKKADMLMIIPEDFSSVIKQYAEGKKADKANFKIYGNMTNSKYIMAAVLTDSFTSKYVSGATDIALPINYTEEFLEKSQPRSEFDLIVPAIIVLSFIMILFSASASIIKEVDKGTIKRLQISRLSTFEFLTGISLVQVIITTIAMGLTFLTAMMMGFRPAGNFFDVLVIGFISSFAIMAISLIVSSFLKSIFDLMTIGCFPFFILMFFSGGMFPLPQIKLFNIGSYVFNVTDFLPTSHAVTALGKILNYGSGLKDVSFEITAMAVLTVAYFIIGVWLFKRRHMKTA